MARFLKSRKISYGEIPGSLIFIGNKKMEKTGIQWFLYNKEEFEEKLPENFEDIPAMIPENSVLWINIDGLHDVELISRIGDRFNISPLELEDILNTDQRPKVTEDDNNITIFLKTLEYRETTHKIHGDQVSFVIGKNYLITFQERSSAFFEPVRDRIRNNKGRVRNCGSDYLAYALMDTMVDDYIHNIEKMGTQVEILEEEVLLYSKKDTPEKIYRLKTNIGFIRKTIWPMKEIMSFLNKSESKLLQKKTHSFLKDLQDLSTQALESVEIYHNLTNDYLNIYNANQSNRANEVMKFLTIFASLFIPLTFIAGVYGTNFEYVPELHLKSGYFIMLGVMLAVAIAMLYYFRKKDWL